MFVPQNTASAQHAVGMLAETLNPKIPNSKVLELKALKPQRPKALHAQ